MRTQSPSWRGFTLIELMVVVLIIGILAAIAVPSYMKAIENSKADDAVAMMQMVATANRMYKLDHGGTYTTGTIDANCNPNVTTACPVAAGGGDRCNLVTCKYLAAQNWTGKAYTITAGNGTTCSSYSGVACVKRKAGTYVAWYYTINESGVITAGGGAPTPIQ